MHDDWEKERNRDADREREKRSWREIDQLRDKSQHVVREKRPSKKDYELIKKKSEERQALEQLFGDHKPNKEKEKFLRAIREAKNKQDFAKAVARYEKKFSLPRDWHTLLLLLDHEQPRVVLHAIRYLWPLYPHRIPEEQELLRSHLNVLKMTTRDSEVEEAVEGFLAQAQG